MTAPAAACAAINDVRVRELQFDARSFSEPSRSRRPATHVVGAVVRARRSRHVFSAAPPERSGQLNDDNSYCSVGRARARRHGSVDDRRRTTPSPRPVHCVIIHIIISSSSINRVTSETSTSGQRRVRQQNIAGTA